MLQSGFSEDFCDTVCATLVFPENRLAQFTVSYYANKLDEYVIAGTKGSIRLSPAFMYKSGLEFSPLTVGEKQSHETFKHTDQFGGELQYFSECIQKVNDLFYIIFIFYYLYIIYIYIISIYFILSIFVLVLWFYV